MNIDDITPVTMSDLTAAAQPAVAVIESAAESIDLEALADSLGDAATAANDAIVELAAASGSLGRRAGRRAASAATSIGRAAARRPALTASITVAAVGVVAFSVWRSRNAQADEPTQPVLIAA